MSQRAGYAIFLAALVVLGACATTQISLRAGTRTYTPRDYDRVYGAWTRSTHDYSWRKLKDVLRVSATFESWDFRWAYVTRYAHDFSLDTSARDEMLRTTLEDARRHHRFLVTLTGEVHREGNLTSRHSAWRVLLVDEEGNQTTPREIERVRPVTAAEWVYFPSVNHHRETFRVAFPTVRPDGRPSIPPDAREVVLLFTGARGRVPLRWQLEEAADERD